MQGRNTFIIWIISLLIIIFTILSISSDFRRYIRQFIGDDTSHYYLETINISNYNGSISSDIIKHTIVRLNDRFIGYSKQINKLIEIDAKEDLNIYVNIKTQNCSNCHLNDQDWP